MRASTSRGAWERLRADVAEWPETALISHEFFAAASTEQAARMVADLAPAEVHLVVTGREPLGLFTASWQESIKNRDTTPDGRLRPHRVDRRAPAVSGTGARSTSTACSSAGRPRSRPSGCTCCRCRVRTPRGARSGTGSPRLVGVDPDSVDLTQSFPNASMGVVEAETLRRINHHLDDFNSAIDRGTYIRTFLADERLVPRKGDPFWPDEERIEEIRERGRAAVDYIAAQGFDVIGDLDSLLVPDELPRAPDAGVGHRRRGRRGRRRAGRPDAARRTRPAARAPRSCARSSREAPRARPRTRVCASRSSRRFPWLRHVLLRGGTAPGRARLDVRWVMVTGADCHR